MCSMQYWHPFAIARATSYEDPAVARGVGRGHHLYQIFVKGAGKIREICYRTVYRPPSY